MLPLRSRPDDGSNSGNPVAERLIKSIQVLVSIGFSCFHEELRQSNQEDLVLLIMWFINSLNDLTADRKSPL